MKKKIYVVVDWETRRALYASTSEEEAADFADELWTSNPSRDYLVSDVFAYLMEDEH